MNETATWPVNEEYLPSQNLTESLGAISDHLGEPGILFPLETKQGLSEYEINPQVVVDLEKLIRSVAAGVIIGEELVRLSREELIVLSCRLAIEGASFLDAKETADTVRARMEQGFFTEDDVMSTQESALNSLCKVVDHSLRAQPKIYEEESSLDGQRVEALVKGNIGLARVIAKKYARGDLQLFEDFFAEGCFGLAQAAQRYDASLGASFGSFAAVRIKGAIIDSIRERFPGPRSEQVLVPRINKAKDFLAQALEREPTHDEIADYLGVDRKKIDAAVSSSLPVPFSSLLFDQDQDPLELNLASDPIDDGFQEVDRREELDLILELAKSRLSERHIYILRSFITDRPRSDIAQHLGITESRVSQLLNSEIIPTLKKASTALEVMGYLEEFYDYEFIFGLLPPTNRDEKGLFIKDPRLDRLIKHIDILAKEDDSFDPLVDYLNKRYRGKLAYKNEQEGLTELFKKASFELGGRMPVRMSA